ncbi:(2Fe-2S)-binding protein [Hydrogenophaga sp. OTU3427]|uniref:(2Fe-2S)-binding protein n=1 Tax=Hydrogenophaga sp. OTU3427 TaxID=3043856 RepID=UPI00313BA5A3
METDGGWPVQLNVNGVAQRAVAPLTGTLLSTLREDLCLTAAKRGCNQGVCGACTVLIDGRTARACLTLSQNAEDRAIQTLEGLRGDPVMQALQAAFASGGAFQCGFCTPGMLISAYALLKHNPRPTEADVRGHLSGNLCRCTGYVSIIAAVDAAAQALSGQEKFA